MNEAKPSTRRMRIFRGEGTPLAADMMTPEGLTDDARDAFQAAVDAGMDHGHRVRCLHRDDGPGGMSLCRMWLKSNFVTPRHQHDVDCLYYVLGGSMRAGNAELYEGEGLFVPAGTVYHIEAGDAGLHVLEFRNASTFNVLYTKNTTVHWDKVVGACANNVDRWRQQAEPPASA